MKASDSTNSLTELTQQQECFICLMHENELGEPLVDSKLLRTCGCKFTVHPVCWNVWIKDKSDYDCPICRQQSILRIHIPPNPVLLVEHETDYRVRFTRFQIILILLFIGFAIGLITSLVFKN